MSDITICTNEDCFYHRSCGRFKANAHPTYQSYQRFEPYQRFDRDGHLEAFTCDSNMLSDSTRNALKIERRGLDNDIPIRKMELSGMSEELDELIKELKRNG